MKLALEVKNLVSKNIKIWLKIKDLVFRIYFYAKSYLDLIFYNLIRVSILNYSLFNIFWIDLVISYKVSSRGTGCQLNIEIVSERSTL